MEIVVVATHNERYFESFIDSLKKYKIKPTILGWNTKYTGHLMKDELLEDYLTKKKQRRIILFCDAFDCIFIRDPKELFKQFLESNKEIIISNEDTNNNIFVNNIQKLYFGTINNELINTGMIIGYSDTFLNCLKIIKNYRIKNINSNQKIWSNAMINNDYLKKTIHIDIENNFFFNHNSFTNKIEIRNNMVYIIKKKKYPFVLQGNGNKNINYICSKLGIKQQNHTNRGQLKYNINFIYYYLLPFVYQLILLIFIIIIIILLALLLKKKKNLFKY